MQLVVDDAAGELMTGAFANVSLDLASPEVALSVPASTLIFDQDGLKVATMRRTAAADAARFFRLALFCQNHSARRHQALAFSHDGGQNRGRRRGAAWASGARVTAPFERIEVFA